MSERRPEKLRQRKIMLLKANFYVEGIDGVGKSTLLETLSNRITDKYLSNLIGGFDDDSLKIVPFVSPTVRKYGFQSLDLSTTSLSNATMGQIQSVNSYLNLSLKKMFNTAARSLSVPVDAIQDQASDLLQKMELLNMSSISSGLINSICLQAVLEDIDAATVFVNNVTDWLDNNARLLDIRTQNTGIVEDLIFINVQLIDRSPVSTFAYNVRSSENLLAMDKYHREAVATPILANFVSILDSDAMTDKFKDYLYEADRFLFDKFFKNDGSLNRNVSLNATSNDGENRNDMSQFGDMLKTKEEKDAFEEVLLKFLNDARGTTLSKVREFSAFVYLSLCPSNCGGEHKEDWDRIASIFEEREQLSDLKPTNLFSKRYENIESLKEVHELMQNLMLRNDGSVSQETVRNIVLRENNPVVIIDQAWDYDTDAIVARLEKHLVDNFYELLNGDRFGTAAVDS